MNFKKYKKYLGIAVFLTAAVMMCGCAKKTETAVKKESVSAVETQAGSGAAAVQAGAQSETEPETAETAEAAVVKAETLSEADSLLLHVTSGTVAEVGTGTILVKTDRYPEGVTFATEGAAAGFASEPAADQEITVFYRGDIKNGDASGVTVELLRDKRDGDSEAQAAEVTGKVSGIGMSVISIETTDGRSLSFEQDPKPVNTTTGPVEGDTVTILYSYQDEGQEGAVVPELIKN